MKKENISRYKKDILCALAVAAALFITLYFFLGFAKSGLDVPYSYVGGDDMGPFLLFKTAKDTGWIWNNEFIGSPFGANLIDYSSFLLQNVEVILFKIISLFVDYYVVAVNIQLLLTFSLSGLSAFLVLRALKINRKFAFLGGVLFGLAPYMFCRGLGHFMLTVCYMIPLSILLCVWASDDDEAYLKFNRYFLKYKKNVLTIIFCVLIANNGGGYYQFFSCFFLCVVAVCNIMREKKVSALKKPLFSLALILLFFLLALLPYAIYVLRNGANDAVVRSITDLEQYGLKIIQMFIPLNDHGIAALQTLIQGYSNNMPLVNENSSAYLGIGAATGFLIILVTLFFPLEKMRAQTRRELFLFSRLTIAAILFFSIGGFVVIVLFPVPVLRGFNRVSIYIMFMGLCVLCKCLQMLKEHTFKKAAKQKQRLLSLAMAGFTALCLFDQLPTYGANDAILAANRDAFQSDQRFIETIEGQLQSGDMVFQLPYHPYPESGVVNAMGDYSLLRGYLHSDTLRWSYGGMKGRESDQWNAMVSDLPMQDMIDAIISEGFRGIYIDTMAYTSEELAELQTEIEEVIEESAIISDNGMLLFYNLYPYIERNPSYLDSQQIPIEKMQFKYGLGDVVAFDGTKNDAHRYFVQGISGTETDFAWSDGQTAELMAYVGETEGDLTLTLNLKMVYCAPQQIIVQSGDEVLINHSIISIKEPLVIKVPSSCIQNGIINLNFFFPNATSPAENGESADTRSLSIAIASFVIDEAS